MRLIRSCAGLGAATQLASHAGRGTLALATVALATLWSEPVSAAFDPALLREERMLSIGGCWPAGHHAVADLDGDGIDELLGTDHGNWCALAHDPATGRLFVREWEDTWGPAGGSGSTGSILALAVLDVTSDGDPEVVSISYGGHVVVHDIRTRAVEAAVDLPGTRWSAALACDADADGEVEVLLADRFGVTCYGLDGGERWRYSAIGGRALAAGQADSDPALEVALVDTSETAILDGAAGGLEWTPPVDFGLELVFADLDGDGIQEVAHTGLGGVSVVDVAARITRWTRPRATLPWSAGALMVHDLDDDGRPEVVVAPDQWGDPLVLDGATGVDLWSVDNRDSEPQRLLAADTDGDCRLELGWSIGLGTSGPDVLVLLEPRTGAELRRRLVERPTKGGFAVGDGDGDGVTEVRRISDAVGLVSDRRHHPRADRRVDLAPWHWVGSALTAQADGDPGLEWILGFAGGNVAVLDGASDALQWESGTASGSAHTIDLDVGDVDADGVLDVAWASTCATTGCPGPRAWIRRVTDGGGSWSRTGLGPTFANPSLRLANLDADPALEIIVAVSGAGLWVWDGLTGALEWDETVANTFEAVDVVDADGDGDLDVLTGRSSGGLTAWRGDDGRALWTEPGTVGVDELAVGDLDGDGLAEVLVVRAYRTLEIRRMPDRSLAWQVPLDGPDVDGSSSLGGWEPVIADSDDDGLLEILVNTDEGVRIFEYGSAPSDVEAPAFDVGPSPTATLAPAPPCCPGVDLAWTLADDDDSVPIEYRVYRSEVDGFDPVPADLVARTPVPILRDSTALPGRTVHYVVRAVDARGNEDDNREQVSIAVPAVVPVPPPTDVRLALEACGTTAIIEFTHPGTPPDVTFVLLVDGSARGPITSGATVDVGDELPHGYAIRAVDACGGWADSAEVVGQRSVARPTGVALVDADPCTIGAATLRVVHPGLAAGRLELWQDGALLLAPVVDGQEIVLRDAVTHVFVVRAVAEPCGAFADSDPVSFTDGVGCGTPGEVLLRVAHVGPGEDLLTWTPAVGARTYDAHVGSLSSLRGARAYDHVRDPPGVTFPDSPTPGNGCDAAGGPDTAARVVGLDGPDAYLLVVAADGALEGPYGRRSDGIDRSDPSVDPRPRSPCP